MPTRRLGIGSGGERVLLTMLLPLVIDTNEQRLAANIRSIVCRILIVEPLLRLLVSRHS